MRLANGGVGWKGESHTSGALFKACCVGNGSEPSNWSTQNKQIQAGGSLLSQQRRALLQPVWWAHERGEAGRRVWVVWALSGTDTGP